MTNLNSFASETGLSSALTRIDEIQRLENYINDLGNKTGASVLFSDVIKEVSAKVIKQKLEPVICQVSKENNIDANLVKAVIEQESQYNPTAVSEAGALGLMQLMPATAKALGVKDPLNPVENIRAGTKYLSSLLNRYQGNVVLALSAYNAGPDNVDKYKGVPPFEETKNYLEKITSKLTKV